MSQITLRGIDPELEKKIRNIAREQGKSLNYTILEIVYKHYGFKKENQKAPADSLRKLAGGWSEKDASDFLDSIKSCEQIDDEMWK